jgi:flagellar protein FlbD
VILVTRFNGSKLYINAELIRSIEETPDTVIGLLDTTKLVVHETADQIIERVVEYRRKINTPWNFETGEGRKQDEPSRAS